MEQQLQIKPFEQKSGLQYEIIQLTDITLHSSYKQPTRAIGKSIQRSLDQNKPGRFYGFKTNEIIKENKFKFNLSDFLNNDPNFLRMVQEKEKQGIKILIKIPKQEIPIKLGKDAEEFINSRNGQRIIRKINQSEEF